MHPSSKQKKSQRAREATVVCYQEKVKRTNCKQSASCCSILPLFRAIKTLHTFLVNKNSAPQISGFSVTALHHLKTNKQNPNKTDKAELGQWQRLQMGKNTSEFKQLLILTLPYKSYLYVKKGKLQGEKYFLLYCYLLLLFSTS